MTPSDQAACARAVASAWANDRTASAAASGAVPRRPGGRQLAFSERPRGVSADGRVAQGGDVGVLLRAGMGVYALGGGRTEWRRPQRR